jgi:hypothetical protein
MRRIPSFLPAMLHPMLPLTRLLRFGPSIVYLSASIHAVNPTLIWIYSKGFSNGHVKKIAIIGKFLPNLFDK